jgi:hypothetical protein
MCGDRFNEEGENYALMICVTYELTRGGEIGIDAQMFDIQGDERFPTGPLTHKLIGYGWNRLIE